ncbi:hypothetical protein DP187_21805 [Enterobacter cloacae]|nr:hypothetical protein DP187_21805 [Enterobacter cloacae]
MLFIMDETDELLFTKSDGLPITLLMNISLTTRCVDKIKAYKCILGPWSQYASRATKYPTEPSLIT